MADEQRQTVRGRKFEVSRSARRPDASTPSAHPQRATVHMPADHPWRSAVRCASATAVGVRWLAAVCWLLRVGLVGASGWVGQFQAKSHRSAVRGSMQHGATRECTTARSNTLGALCTSALEIGSSCSLLSSPSGCKKMERESAKRLTAFGAGIDQMDRDAGKRRMGLERAHTMRHR